MTPKSKKKVRPIRAWAVFDNGKIAWWQFTKADQHCDVYLTKSNAEIARAEWEESSGEGFEVIKVEITPINRKKIK